MKNIKHRLLAILMTLVMVVGLLPAGALAEGEDDDSTALRAGGITEYHVMNNDNNLYREIAAQINEANAATTENAIAPSDISINKIEAFGSDGSSTNPDFWNNGWRNGKDWYYIYNVWAWGLSNPECNDGVKLSKLAGINIYAHTSSDKTVKTYTVPIDRLTTGKAGVGNIIELYISELTDYTPTEPAITSYTYTINYSYDNASGQSVPSTSVLSGALAAASALPDGVTANAQDGKIVLTIPAGATTTEGKKQMFNYGPYVFETLTDNGDTWTLKNGGQDNKTTVDVSKDLESSPLLYKKEASAPVTTYDAWFFLRTDGAIPTETGSSGYDVSLYAPNHDSGTPLTGKVTDKNVYTNYSGIIAEDGTINGTALDKAFKAVSDAIETEPTPAAIQAAAPGFDPETQGVAWYVVKNNVGTTDKCPGVHVDGIIYNKSQVNTYFNLTYMNNFPGVEGDTSFSFVPKLPANEKATITSDFPAAPDGYTFTGWNTDPTGKNGTAYSAGEPIMMDGDKALFAQWKLKTYAVTYDWGTQNIPESVKNSLPTASPVSHGGSYTVDSNYTGTTTVKANGGTYTFSGWSKTGTLTNITAPVTITGAWSFVKDEEPPVVEKTTKIEVFHFYVTQGNTLDETYEQKLGEGGIVLSTSEDITKSYVDGLASLDHRIGEALKALGMEYKGYEIYAFKDGGPQGGEKVTLGETGHVDLSGVKELRIHLNYYETRYSVTYNSNGGTVGEGKNTFRKYYNTANDYTISDNAGDGNPNFTRTNYTFDGWSTDELGENKVAVGTVRDALEKGQTTTYYAQWKLNPPTTTYKVTYNYTGSVPNGMTAPVDQSTYAANAQVTLATAPTAPTYYTFGGWVLPEGITATEGKFKMPDRDVTITGSWTYTAPSGGGDSGPTYRTVTVNYLEQGSNKVLADAYTHRDTYNSTYDVTAEAAKAIDGYEIADVDGETAGRLLRNLTINVYYTAVEDIPEEDTPLAPGPDTGDNGDVDIPNEDTPLAPNPDTPDNGGTVIEDEDAPLGNLPQTGTTAQSVNPALTLGLLALAFSMAAAGLTVSLTRKKEEEN